MKLSERKNPSGSENSRKTRENSATGTGAPGGKPVVGSQVILIRRAEEAKLERILRCLLKEK
jgi:hypothetical protein